MQYQLSHFHMRQRHICRPASDNPYLILDQTDATNPFRGATADNTLIITYYRPSGYSDYSETSDKITLHPPRARPAAGGCTPQQTP